VVAGRKGFTGSAAERPIETGEWSRHSGLTRGPVQSLTNEPYYILFEDFTHVSFYRRSLREACELDGARFDGFQHVDNWVPQQFVTATGPDPLPR
jgi:hypothetical protein